MMLLLAAEAVAQADRSGSPWWDASMFLVREAYEGFRRAEGMDKQEAAFGEAVTLLNLQPRTQGNIVRAIALLEQLNRETPADSPVNALARFFWARAQEFYLNPPNLEAAEAAYRELLQRRTGNPVVEIAASRLIIMTAFAPGSSERILAGLAELEGLLPLLDTPQGRREFHVTMGYAILDNGGSKAAAIGHFREADRIGFTRKATAVRLWVTAGSVAQSAGLNEDAVFFYQQALRAYPRDPRAYTIRQRLAELGVRDG